LAANGCKTYLNLNLNACLNPVIGVNYTSVPQGTGRVTNHAPHLLGQGLCVATSNETEGNGRSSEWNPTASTTHITPSTAMQHVTKHDPTSRSRIQCCSIPRRLAAKAHCKKPEQPAAWRCRGLEDLSRRSPGKPRHDSFCIPVLELSNTPCIGPTRYARAAHICKDCCLPPCVVSPRCQHTRSGLSPMLLSDRASHVTPTITIA
jgi:hypothetical protein